jgi:hypothetical protein
MMATKRLWGVTARHSPDPSAGPAVKATNAEPAGARLASTKAGVAYVAADVRRK